MFQALPSIYLDMKRMGQSPFTYCGFFVQLSCYKYHFDHGTQGPEHYHPGNAYEGTTRTAYFPDCPEGRAVVDLLKTAWDRKLVFTIGSSVTNGKGYLYFCLHSYLLTQKTLW